MARALEQVVARPEFRAQRSTGPHASLLRALREYLLPIGVRILGFLLARRTRGLLRERADWIRDETAAARASLEAEKPERRLDLLYLLLGRLFQHKLERRLMPLMGAAVAAHALAARLCDRSLDDPDIVALGRALPGNVTTDMDLAAGDLADVARRLPAVRAYFLQTPASALAELDDIEGGAEFREQLESFLERYGMRGPSEIDVARPRWREDPSPLLRSVAGNLSREEPGLHRLQHERLAREAEAAAERLVCSARRGLLGPLRARLVRHFLRVQRDLLGVREHPKLLLVCFMDLAKVVVLEQARALVERRVLRRVEDVWLLELDELHALARGRSLAGDVGALVARRAAEQERFAALYPPRVITSDGEVVVAQHERGNLPAGALAGSGVSAGVVEGRARVVRDPTEAALEHGEVLVAPFTDPGWTPLFIHAAALVTEVGGLMTHGSVVAREYGIPAVVCVPDATRLIRTGQRVRVDGDRGCVEILEDGMPYPMGVPGSEALAARCEEDS